MMMGRSHRGRLVVMSGNGRTGRRLVRPGLVLPSGGRLMVSVQDAQGVVDAASVLDQ